MFFPENEPQSFLLLFSKIHKLVESKINDGDLKGAAQLLFSSDTSAPDTAETLAALQNKHPPAPAVPDLPDPPSPASPCLLSSEDAVQHAIMSFKNGSAGGLDGLTPQHLKDLTIGMPGGQNTNLVSSITRMVNMMLTGKVNSDVVATLYGANLFALKKRRGNPSYRCGVNLSKTYLQNLL